jgi:predicted nucleic acid-binding protein
VIVVIDASVALQWVLPESGSEAAGNLRSEELIAPAFWLVEAASALWRRCRRGEMSSDQASARLSELLNAPVTSLPIEPYVDPALRLAVALGHPVYDCLYLAVAVQHRTHVITADRRFAALANSGEMKSRVRLLED